MEPNQAGPCDRLHREEIHRGDRAPVRAQERAPRTAFAAFGRGVHAGLDKDALHRVAADVVAEVVQGASDARLVAPGRIILGHAQHELDDGGLSTGRVLHAVADAVISAMSS